MVSMNHLKIWILTLLSFVIGIFFWDKINLPFENKQNIVGVLSKYEFNPINNDLRFVFLCFLVFFTFYISSRFISSNNKSIFQIFYIKNYEAFKVYEKNNILSFLFYSFLTLIFLEFFITNLPKEKLDFFHEGEWLSPSYHFFLTKEIWSGSFFIHGLFYDLIKPIISWKIFNEISIGAVRYFDLILILITKILLLVLCLQTSKIQNLSKIKTIIYFSILSILCLKLIRYDNLGYNYFTYRDLPILFLLSLSIKMIDDDIKSKLTSIIVGTLPVISILITIDRGIYCLTTVILIVLILILNRKFLNLFFLLLGFSISLLIIKILIPYNEIEYFFKSTMEIIKIKPFLDNYIYPTPFIGGDTFSSKAILTILIGGLLSINILMKNKNNSNKKFFFFLILLLFISIIIFKNALGRSDASHIRYSLGFNYFLIVICLLNIILKSHPNEEKLNKYFVLVPLVIFSLTLFILNKSNSSLKNIINYKIKINDYVSLKDKFFLREETRIILDFYSTLVKNQNCEINFTNEPAWSYLLKKKSCTRYYVHWFASSDKLQNDYIKKIEEKNINYILYDSKGKLLPDGFKNEERHKIIHQYLIKNYSPFKSINGWIFFKNNKML